MKKPRQVFVDTSALIALAYPPDAHHEAAHRFLDGCGRASFATSDFNVAEYYNKFAEAPLAVRRSAVAALRSLTRRGMRILPGGKYFNGAVQAYEANASEDRDRPGLVDELDFVLMRARHLREAFAFDGDFAQSGLKVVPAPEA